VDLAGVHKRGVTYRDAVHLAAAALDGLLNILPVPLVSVYCANQPGRPNAGDLFK